MNEVRPDYGRQCTFTVTILIILALLAGCASSGSMTAADSSPTPAAMQPMDITEGVSCGRCGMFPANYPRWQSQIIFSDHSMTPFDGCKCMFNFMNSMAQYDKDHSMEDVKAVLVKDFNTGEWLNAQDAYFVVGSKMMGPMGKELIPFTSKAAAMKLQDHQSGSLMTYAEITPEVLMSLMGGMKQGQGSGHMGM